MNFAQSFVIAIGMLRLHKLRAFLTMLGVIIGVMSVTLIVMASEGFRFYINEEFNKLGADTLFIFFDGSRLRRGESTGGISGMKVDDVQYILNRASTIDIASGSADLGSREVRYNEASVPDASITGVDAFFLELNRVGIAQGRKFRASDIEWRENVCMIGDELKNLLFSKSVDPVGKRLVLKGITLEIIGVLEKIDIGPQSTGKMIMLPITTMQDKWTGGDDIRSITMRPKKGVSVQAAMADVWQVMMQKSGNRPIYKVDSRESILNVFGTVLKVTSIVLGAIAAMSLLVGGIGIMNIMLVSVTERTREIGLRKAVGAKSTAVLTQFLVESAVLSLAGGLIGMGLGWLIAKSVTLITGMMGMFNGNGITTVFPLQTAFLAILFSAFIGVVFGGYPAYSAAKLDPIVALRSE